MTDDWHELTGRAGRAAHDLVGWLMWDEGAIGRFEELGVPDGAGWIVAWRLAPLGDAAPAVAASATYSIDSSVIAMVMDLYRGVTDAAGIGAARDASVGPGLDDIAPGLSAGLGPLAGDLWRGVDATHGGARPMFAALAAEPRPPDGSSALSAWRAVNCLRELRGDNHWALCASEDLDAVEVGLLHSVMVDPSEYGDEEWIARSRGNDDDAITAGWERLAHKGLAEGAAISAEGRRFRLELEHRTNVATAPAWQAVGATTTRALCGLVDAHHDAFVARIDATAGPRWMPAVRQTPTTSIS